MLAHIDWVLLFGSYLLCGAGIGILALAIRWLLGATRLANSAFVPLWIVATWSLTAMDLYGPYRLFRVHALWLPDPRDSGLRVVVAHHEHRARRVPHHVLRDRTDQHTGQEAVAM